MVPDVMITSVNELIRDTEGSVGCSNHALVEFEILRDMDQVRNKVRHLNCRKANSQLSKEIVGRIPWQIALRDKGV